MFAYELEQMSILRVSVPGAVDPPTRHIKSGGENGSLISLCSGFWLGLEWQAQALPHIAGEVAPYEHISLNSIPIMPGDRHADFAPYQQGLFHPNLFDGVQVGIYVRTVMPRR